MKIRVLFTSAIAVLAAVQSYAFIFTQAFDEEALQCKVKQIDEFFNRFNLEVDYKGEPISVASDSMAMDSLSKMRNLASLLDLDKFVDSEHRPDSLAVEFLNYVISHEKRINYADSTWQAEAEASVVAGNKTYPLTLILHTENVRDVIFRWVISDVDTPLMSALTDSLTSSVSIMPGAHGSSFITLAETINLNAKNVRSLFPKDYTPDRLSLFAYLVSTGKIKIKNVSKVVYRFRLDDYEFTVERHEKGDTMNNGWLISRITKRIDTK